MTDLAVSDRYPELIQTLLAGKAICANSYPVLYRVLDQSETDESDMGSDDETPMSATNPDRQMAEQTLKSMGRRLARIDNVYFAAFESTTAQTEDLIRQRFKSYQQWTPFLTEIFEILRVSRPSGDDMEVGESFDFNEVLNAVMQNTALVDRLVNAVSKLATLKRDTPEYTLRYAIKTLEKQNFVVSKSSRYQTYVVTGEKALFDAFRDLVIELEQVDMESETAEDGSPASQPTLI